MDDSLHLVKFLYPAMIMDFNRVRAASNGLLRLLSETGLFDRLIMRIPREVFYCASMGATVQALDRWDNAPFVCEITLKAESGIRREVQEVEIDPVVNGCLMRFG